MDSNYDILETILTTTIMETLTEFIWKMQQMHLWIYFLVFQEWLLRKHYVWLEMEHDTRVCRVLEFTI